MNAVGRARGRQPKGALYSQTFASPAAAAAAAAAAGAAREAAAAAACSRRPSAPPPPPPPVVTDRVLSSLSRSSIVVNRVPGASTYRTPW